jgi:hypothetical protein
MATSFTLEKGRVQDVINLILAICLFLSPWAVGFTGDMAPAWNAWIVGVALAVLAIAALTAFAEWEEWVNAVLGVWLIIAPWLLGFAGHMPALWTHVVLGALIVVASGWAVWEYRHTPHVAA